jgi:regulator of RNase E activity RraB
MVFCWGTYYEDPNGEDEDGEEDDYEDEDDNGVRH